MALNKQAKIVLLVAPVILIVLGFVLIPSGDSEDTKTREAEINDAHLEAEMHEKEDVFSEASGIQSKQQQLRNRKSRFSINDDDDMFGWSEEEPESEVLEEPKEEEVKEDPKTKVVYRTRYVKSKEQPKETPKEQPQFIAQNQPQVPREDFGGFVKGGADGVSGNAKMSKEFYSAVVHNKQVVRSGSEVRIRTTEEAIINDVVIPRNSYMIGHASVSGERMVMTITSIQVHGKPLNCNLTVHDKTDGLEGIHIPGNVNQEIVQGASDDAMQQASQSGTSVSVPGIGTVTTGANKKKNDPTVSLRSGYKIMIRYNKK